MPQPETANMQTANTKERSSFLGMELFHENKRRLGGRCTVTGGGDHLTAKFGTDVARRENTRNIGAHFCIGDDEALLVLGQICRQKACGRGKPTYTNRPFTGSRVSSPLLRFLTVRPVSSFSPCRAVTTLLRKRVILSLCSVSLS